MLYNVCKPLPPAIQSDQVQYCVYTWTSQYNEVLAWLSANGILFETHLARTRFNLIDPGQRVVFFLKFAGQYELVEDL